MEVKMCGQSDERMDQKFGQRSAEKMSTSADTWSDHEIEVAKCELRGRTGLFEQADPLVEGFLKVPLRGPTLKTARLGLLFSMAGVAKKLGMTPSAYSRMEAAEVTGTISVKN